jgi:hypothetical protein
MKLLGDRNWYVPGWLQRLPRCDHHVERIPEPARVPVAA